jgi:hypothetical protein
MDVINGKAGKAAALPKFSDALPYLNQGGRLCPTMGFASPKFFLDYAPEKYAKIVHQKLFQQFKMAV